MTTIEIDLNSIREDGLTRARRSNAVGELRQGHMVEAIEPEDGVSMPALVERAEDGSPYVFLRVNRQAMERIAVPHKALAVEPIVGNGGDSRRKLTRPRWSTISDHYAIVKRYSDAVKVGTDSKPRRQRVA